MPKERALQQPLNARHYSKDPDLTDKDAEVQRDKLNCWKMMNPVLFAAYQTFSVNRW